eukprot:TRINITY_DN2953_c0_g1_i1.p1 TRINITY_DN2953_c0_g1~~TRINITY_DN2953_c0_g1_i1.p1  ORF type:complete len:245 (+),score=78.62 TRINITY_DN2953_c0_g1_i1:57-737(+)
MKPVLARSVGLLFFCLFFSFVSCQEQFSFHNYFQGKWELNTFLYRTATNQMIEELEAVNYTVRAVNDDLFGTFMGRDKEEVQIKLEFKKNSTTVGEYLQSKDEEIPSLLFAFDFKPTTNAFFVSSGSWLGDEGDSYLFLISSTHSFELTIFNSKEKKTTVMLGRKASTTPPQSFWQRYGMMVPVAIMFFSNFLNKRRDREAAPSQREEAQPQSGAQAQTQETKKDN